MSNFNMEKDWKAPVIKIGRISLLIASALSFLPVLYLHFVHGILPPVSLMLKSWGMIALLFGAFYIVEDVTNIKPVTKEAEVVSTLGIAGSIITNLIGVTLAAFIGTALIRIFPPIIANAFRTYTVPSIFGAVFGQFSVKYTKFAVVGFIISVGLRLFTPLPVWALIAASVFGTIAIAKFLFNSSAKNPKIAA